MENWIRFKIDRHLGPVDAEPLDSRSPYGDGEASLVTMLSAEGFLRLDMVLRRLGRYEAEFFRVGSRSGEGLEVAVLAADADAYVLLRRLRAHSGGITRLAYVYSVLSRSRDAVIFTDASAAILGASARWLELYGLSPEAVLGRNPREVNSRRLPSSFFRDVWRDLTDRQLGSWSGELVNRRASGEPLRVWQTITTFRDADDAVAGYLGVTRDLTPYRDVIERLVDHERERGRELAARDSRRDALLREVSTGLLVLERKLEDRSVGAPERNAAASEEIRALAGAAASLRLRLENVRREAPEAVTAERSEHSRTHFRSLVRTEIGLLSEFARTGGVRVRIHEQGSSPPVLCDRERLRAVLAVVLKTALAKASAAHGGVGVDLSTTPGGLHRLAVEFRCCPGIDLEAPVHAGGGTGAAARGRPSGSSVAEESFPALAKARVVAAQVGAELEWEKGEDGRCWLRLELASDWSGFADRVRVAVLFDRSGKLWTRISEVLSRRGVETFVAHRESDLARLCELEYPSFVGLTEEEPLPHFLAESRIACDGTDVAPAILRFRVPAADGDPVLVAMTASPDFAKAILATIAGADIGSDLNGELFLKEAKSPASGG